MLQSSSNHEADKTKHTAKVGSDITDNIQNPYNVENPKSDNIYF